VADTCAPSQARHSHAHHENARCGNRARGGHHQRKNAAICCGGIDHGLVARKVRLRGQHIHGLGAGDARYPFHRQRLDARSGVLGHALATAHRIKESQQAGADRDAAQPLSSGTLHRQDDIGAGKRHIGRTHLGASGGKALVRDVGASARACLNGDGGAKRDQLLHRFRRGCYASFCWNAFPENGNAGHRDTTLLQIRYAVTGPSSREAASRRNLSVSSAPR
jgi:hypothetical protein